MGDKTMVCGAGCYKFASMLCNCFIGVSRAAEGRRSHGGAQSQDSLFSTI